MTVDYKTAAKAASLGRRETPEDRAVRLLQQLLPRFTSRDDAMQHLYYVDPTSTEQVRLYSIAAALYILGEQA